MDDVEVTKLASAIANLARSKKIKISTDSPRPFWEHPLTLLIFGFLLTAGIGTGISAWVQSKQAKAEQQRRKDEAALEDTRRKDAANVENDRRTYAAIVEHERRENDAEVEDKRQAAEKEREHQRQAADSQRAESTRHYESSTQAVTSFSNALYLRYVRASMVIYAIERGTTPEEVAHRKELYDEALVQQEANVMSSQLLIREALKAQQYDDWEVSYLRSLKPLLRNLDDSVTVATDAYLVGYKREGKPPVVDVSIANKDYDNVRNCEFALVNGIFLTLSTRQYRTSDHKTVISTEDQALREIDHRCATPRSK